MYGAIIGDIAGSHLETLEINEFIKKGKRTYQERLRILDKSTPLFDENSSYTDDTVLTIAVAEAILNKLDYEKNLKKRALIEINKGLDVYGRNRFSKGFIKWVNNESEGNSFGNGAAMRIGPVGYLFNTEKDVLAETKKVTATSHNSSEAILGASEVAIAIFLAKNNSSKKEIENYLINRFGIEFNFDLDELRNNYKFTSNISETVPQALFCFLQSDGFEDAIRTALSIGGDTDTIACIVGSIAEAYYGVPKYLIDEANKYLISEYIDIIKKFYNTMELKLEK